MTAFIFEFYLVLEDLCFLCVLFIMLNYIGIYSNFVGVGFTVLVLASVSINLVSKKLRLQMA